MPDDHITRATSVKFRAKVEPNWPIGWWVTVQRHMAAGRWYEETRAFLFTRKSAERVARRLLARAESATITERGTP